MQHGHKLLMHPVLHKHLFVKEELHYGLDGEVKVVISFLTGKHYSKKLQYILKKYNERLTLYFHPLLEKVKVFNVAWDSKIFAMWIIG